MGVTVRQKEPGRGKPWWVFVVHNGDRTSRKVGSRSAAQEVASQIEARLTLGTFKIKKPQTAHPFKKYAKTWIEKTVPATCKASTEYDYQIILDKHILPVLGEIKVSDITEGQIKNLLFDKVNEGYAASTVTHIKNAASGVLTLAIDEKVITVNPALNLGKKFMQKITDAIEARKVADGENGAADPLTASELKLLLDTVSEHYREHYPLFLLLARTGARIGEAIGLQWGDIDFNGRFINLQKSFSRGRITTLKGKRGRRVDMSRQLTETLKAHRTECKKKGMKLGIGDKSEYVFTNTKGNPIVLNNWRKRVFWKILEKAELRQIRIHDLRHTYATLRISKGDNIADVSNQLGHHSETFTMKIYYKWMPGKKKSEVDELDDLDYIQGADRVQIR